jgi:hypothetical protein
MAQNAVEQLKPFGKTISDAVQHYVAYPAAEFPCVKATVLLCGDGWRLIVLHQVVREWRKHIFDALR